jgi:hypothetical protein
VACWVRAGSSRPSAPREAGQIRPKQHWRTADYPQSRRPCVASAYWPQAARPPQRHQSARPPHAPDRSRCCLGEHTKRASIGQLSRVGCSKYLLDGTVATASHYAINAAAIRLSERDVSLHDSQRESIEEAHAEYLDVSIWNSRIPLGIKSARSHAQYHARNRIWCEQVRSS